MGILTMQIKDYYLILELTPSATLPEIRKAYRRLAHQYHPDKSNNETASALRFAEIKEAYEVLSNPSKKEYYLQQRWYQQSIGRKKFRGIFTAAEILKQSLELERYVSRLDAHRVDQQGLYEYMVDFIQEEMIAGLNTVKDEPINKQVIQAILRSTLPLTLDQLAKLAVQIKKIEPVDYAKQQIQKELDRKKRSHYWERSRPWLVAAMVMLLCLVIYLATR